MAAPAASRLWSPLRSSVFRRILAASLVADLGSFMASVGAAWLMVSLQAGPLYVALTQTAATLPFFLVGLPAGALGDIVDRRKVILVTEAWMFFVAVALAATTLAGVMSPWMLLALTFALSLGQAIESPSWRAVLPELVGRDDIAAAAALNGIEYNAATAVGPALAGLLIATAGVGTAFVVYAVTFFAVIAVIRRWQRPLELRNAPAESLTGATVASIRYVRYAPSIRAVLIRSTAVMFGASALFALLPAVANAVSRSPVLYGVLLGMFGVGAIGGAFTMQQARARWPADALVTAAVAVLGLATIGVGWSQEVRGLLLAMLCAGAAWIVFFSIANAQIQTLSPDWVRARLLAIFMLTTEGGLALGSLVWGAVGARMTVRTALVSAGLATTLSTLLALIWRWPDEAADVTPWVHWRLPTVAVGAVTAPNQGPVLVTVEYRVAPADVEAFLRALAGYEQVRRRDGAFRWNVFRDVERPDLYLETFLVSSWAEHLRQHARFTLADRELENRITALVQVEPVIRHLVQPPPV
jgi:MFS family permease